MKITIINNLYYNEILKKDNEFSHRKNKFYDGKKKENRTDKVCGRLAGLLTKEQYLAAQAKASRLRLKQPEAMFNSHFAPSRRKSGGFFRSDVE
ncbi:hypothetical protein GLN3_11350 [Geobacillus lituanicus]|nr:hypothetical protein GLN3_11350 [Geobacillus lituanicus]